jgi:hypothetical protein
MKRGRRRLPVLMAWVLLAALAPSADAAPRDAKARALDRSHAAAASALDRARALRAGRGVVTGRELTPALAELSARYEALDPAEQRGADRLLARPTDGASDPQAHGYTVPEHAPFCTANFCMHWVTSTTDAPDLTDGDSDGAPDVVEQMAAELQAVRASENGTFGWAAPISDGVRGGGVGKVDVYLADLNGTSLLGYAATDTGQADPHHKFAYMVMDNDYAGQADSVAAMQVTAAHEYNHVLQFAYDAAQDTWMFESTAVWMEDRVYDTIDHYLGFIPTWAPLDEVPLAKTFPDKHYGSAVWNMWLDAQHGPDLIRDAWAGSAGASPQSFAPGAYDVALTAGGHPGFSPSFVSFAADVAEWRTASAFPEGAAYIDVQRRGSLQAGGAPVAPALDHTVYALYTVPQPAGGWPAVLRLDGELPAGVTGGFAIVARTGSDPLAGTVTKVVQQLPAGGAGSVQLPNPAGYGRITAVLANADKDTTGFQGGDWVFSAEAQPFTAAAGVSGSVSEAPVNTAAPTVSGVARDGSQLTAANGAWSGSAPMAYLRQWRRCDSGGGACEDIASADGARYTATEADVGHTLRVRVDASNGAGNATAVSGPTAVVAAIAPAFGGTAPVIDDTTPAVGETLHVSDGSWTGSGPLEMSYQWRRCTTTALNTCTNIALATASAYTVTADDATKRLRVTVTASNSAGFDSRDTAATEAVAADPANTALPTVSGVATDGETLTAGAGAWTGSPTPTVTREWLRCSGLDIASCAGTGASGTSYVLAPADVGSRMRVREHGENGGGSADAASAATAVVTADAPHNASLPQITGTPSDGQLLTATDGSWSGTPPILLSRRWQRCLSGPLTCADIPGEVGERYRLGLADVLAQVRVVVRASNAAGALEVASALSTPVRAGTTAMIRAPLKAKLAAALAGKVAVKVQCSGACAVTARLELTRAVARRLGVARVPARGSGRLAGAGRASVRLAFSAKARKKLRKARKLAGTLAVETHDAGGTLIAGRRGKLTLRR